MSYLLQEAHNIPLFIREKIRQVCKMYRFYCTSDMNCFATISTEYSPCKILSVYVADKLFNPNSSIDKIYYCTVSVKCIHCNTNYILILALSPQFIPIGSPIFVSMEALHTILYHKKQLVPTPPASYSPNSSTFIDTLISNYILLMAYQNPKYYKALRDILRTSPYLQLQYYYAHILPPQYHSPIKFLQSLPPNYWTGLVQFIVKYLKLPYNRFTKLYTPLT